MSNQIKPGFEGPAGLDFAACCATAAAQGVPNATFTLLFPFLEAGYLDGLARLKPASKGGA